MLEEGFSAPFSLSVSQGKGGFMERMTKEGCASPRAQQVHHPGWQDRGDGWHSQKRKGFQPASSKCPLLSQPSERKTKQYLGDWSTQN